MAKGEIDLDTPAGRLRDARIKANFTSARAAAETFGWKLSTYASHETPDGPKARGFDAGWAQRYASAFRSDPAWLLLAIRDKTRVPVLGVTGAAEHWHPFDDGGHEPVDFKVTWRDAIAVLVEGDSMEPAYRHNDVLICQRFMATEQDRFLRRDCVIQTVDGESFVKTVMPGTKKGLFRLRSYNPRYEDKEDVQLEWAAPVMWVKRG